MEIAEKFSRGFVASIMKAAVIRLEEDDTLVEAAARMDEVAASSALVMRADKVVGIVTAHDFVRRMGSGIDPRESVGSMMTRNVISVAANAEIHEAFQAMLSHRIHHLMVVDDSGRAIGILSESDFRKSRGVAGILGLTSVSSLMNDALCKLAPDTPLADVARNMLEAGARYVVVVDDDRPIGIVTEKELVRAVGSGCINGHLGDIVRTAPVTVRETATSAEAAHLMRLHDLRMLAVVGEKGEILGVLSDHDLVRQFEDDYVRILKQVVAGQAKELNENKFYTVVNQLPQRIFIKDTSSIFVACNNTFAQDVGLRPEDIIGKTDLDFFPPELAERYRADDRLVMAERRQIAVEEPYVTPEGKKIWLSTYKAPVTDPDGNVQGVVVICNDITERKQMLEEMERRNWTLRAISLSDKAVVYARTEQEMLEGVCKAITSESRYLLAWIGWAEADENRSVRVAACAGLARAYTDGLTVTWSEGPFGNGPVGMAIRTGQTQVDNDTHSSVSFSPWRDRARRHGMGALVSIPLKIDGRTAGAITVYSSETNAFAEDETKLFEELADSIAFGIHSRRTQAAYEKSLLDIALQANKLELALEDSLAGIAAVLEQRDPYTAGHQKHVAELATQIGRELNLDNERIRALYLSGIVHDLGKIQIPAEILSKPARLNTAELALIRQHPEAGYNVLKKIDFPWPIAEIIREHHEYLDGSGYPRGLRGDDILLEARILTVADIVESMSSDRPYRPALGISEAINEILKMRGVKLDAAVVDACIAVLRRGEFTPHILHLE